MQNWTFLRHGESVANAQGTLCGLVNSPLSALGTQQAVAARQGLGPVTHCLSSDLRRAVQTAETVLQGRRPIRQHPQLRERNMGQWAGRSKKVLRDAGAFEGMRTWSGAPEGGESYADLHRRLIPFLAQQAFPADAGVLLVAHGGVLRVLLAQVDGVLDSATGQLSVPNAEPIVRELPPDFWAHVASRLER